MTVSCGGAEGRTAVPGGTSHTVTRSFRMIGVPASAPVSAAVPLTTSATAVATRPAYESRRCMGFGESVTERATRAQPRARC